MSEAPRPADGDERAAFPQMRFNFAVLVGDVSCFLIGIAFIDSATALPALVTRLGGSATLLGVIGALRQGAYFLPQLFIAHQLQGAARFKPALLVVAFCGRIGYFVAAASIFLFGRTRPDIALAVFTLAYTIAWLGDGCGGVPWTSLVARTIPARRRGGMFALTQILSGVGKIGVGALIVWLLSGKSVSFPASDALLVLGCATLLAISWVFLALIREPALVVEAGESVEAPVEKPRLLEYLRTLPAMMRERPDFGRLALVQILAAASVSTSPFLWGFLRKAAAGGLPEGEAGKFLVAQTVGMLFFAPILGGVTDRSGPRRSLMLLMLLSLLWPAAAFAGKLLGGNVALFYLAYFFLGGVTDNWMTITNYLLESVPPQTQSTYVGLMNAVSFPALVLPLIAGALADHFGEGVSIGFAGALLGWGYFVVRTLPETRRLAAS